MGCRHSTWFLLLQAASLALLATLLTHGFHDVRENGPHLARQMALVKGLGLTDLCLFTEASYTRHLAMTDRFTPFQDYPAALEHFPTGTLVDFPPHLVPRHVDPD